MADSNVRRKQTLLVVDDQPLNILVLYKAFCADYRVLKASSGAEALQVCRAQRPDLVLLDVVMPGLDGFEVCRQLKADPLTRNLPVIFVTAHDDVSKETYGLELGAVDFVAKPINAAVVSARIKTHLNLAHASSLLAATLDASTDGVLVVDLAGGITSMNRALAQMWGLPPSFIDAVSHEAVFDFMDGQLNKAEGQGFGPGSSLQGFDPCRPFEAMELSMLGDRHVELYSTPLEIAGNHRGQVLIFREVTERRRAARDLLLMNESLEFRIKERTQELEVAMDLAQAANLAKSDFLSNMSHEIRTPMNAVIGLTYLALKTDINPKQRDLLEKIHLSGQHLLGIVTEILDFSKIEAGKLPIEEIDFQVQDVFDSVSSLTAEAAGFKGLKLTFESDPSLHQAFSGDPLRVRQVLLNYVSNAIKFTESGEVRVQATSRQLLDGETLIRFEVQDTGIGLTESQMSQLFQAFHQVDTSTTRDHGGTGLGLAVCKQLAELMGGEVGVRSHLDQGSVFWFTCRARPGSLALAGLQAHPAPQQAQRTSYESLRGARVLLVEDNLLNQEVTIGLLESVGVSVAVAHHGRAALDRLAIEAFDGVLMDVQMPVMDGLQATHLIRENPLWAHLPVLALTANVGSEDLVRCIEAGMNDFLAKPVAPDRLFAALAQWLPPREPSPGCAETPTAMVTNAPESVAAPGSPVAVDLAGDPNIIDLSILANVVGGDLQVVRRYSALFLEGTRESILELDVALQQGDVFALADLGHRMKSSARMVGALGLAALCESLEGLRAEGLLSDAKPIVEKIHLTSARIAADIEVLTKHIEA